MRKNENENENENENDEDKDNDNDNDNCERNHLSAVRRVGARGSRVSEEEVR